MPLKRRRNCGPQRVGWLLAGGQGRVIGRSARRRPPAPRRSRRHGRPPAPAGARAARGRRATDGGAWRRGRGRWRASASEEHQGLDGAAELRQLGVGVGNAKAAAIAGGLRSPRGRPNGADGPASSAIGAASAGPGGAQSAGAAGWPVCVAPCGSPARQRRDLGCDAGRHGRIARPVAPGEEAQRRRIEGLVGQLRQAARS